MYIKRLKALCSLILQTFDIITIVSTRHAKVVLVMRTISARKKETAPRAYRPKLSGTPLSLGRYLEIYWPTTKLFKGKKEVGNYDTTKHFRFSTYTGCRGSVIALEKRTFELLQTTSDPAKAGMIHKFGISFREWHEGFDPKVDELLNDMAAQIEKILSIKLIGVLMAKI